MNSKTMLILSTGATAEVADKALKWADNDSNKALRYIEADCDVRKYIVNFIHYTATTQTALAEAIGVKKQYLNDYLLGKVDSIKVELACRDYINSHD